MIWIQHRQLEKTTSCVVWANPPTRKKVVEDVVFTGCSSCLVLNKEDLKG